MLTLTRTHKAEVLRLTAEIARTGVLRTNAEELCRRYVSWIKTIEAERDAAHDALRAVAKLETPSCAHIGKRMAATARQALPGGEG